MIRVLTLDERREQLGAYVQGCRMAVGYSIESLAEQISTNSGTARLHGLVLALIEAGRHLPTQAYLDRISAILPMNRAVVRNLAAPNALPTRH